jgi:hypothetical protein
VNTGKTLGFGFPDNKFDNEIDQKYRDGVTMVLLITIA